MIPKIIHLCWLSGDPYPTDIQLCLDSWKKHLPDYEIWLWDTKRFDIDSTRWTRQAFDAKKYAFAADYIRLYALYNYGGIYLDSDVLVYKSFDPLLSLPYFVGHDQAGCFEAAVIGCEPGCQWIKDILDSYEGMPFIREDGTYDMLPMPCRFRFVLSDKGYKFYKIKHLEDLDASQYDITQKQMYVFDGQHFNGRDSLDVHPTKKAIVRTTTQAVGKTGKNFLKSILPKWIVKTIYAIGWRTWRKKEFSKYQIPFEKKQRRCTQA